MFEAEGRFFKNSLGTAFEYFTPQKVYIHLGRGQSKTRALMKHVEELLSQGKSVQIIDYSRLCKGRDGWKPITIDYDLVCNNPYSHYRDYPIESMLKPMGDPVKFTDIWAYDESTEFTQEQWTKYNEHIRRRLKMNIAFVILWMIFFHIVDDYYLQGWLASAKQKSWWEENYRFEKYKYKNDYIWALIMHSFSWSFMIMLPIAYVQQFGIGWRYVVMFIVNLIVHAVVDNLKANKKTINLWQDQTIHLAQIMFTAFALLV